jgi:hypothetical protein
MINRCAFAHSLSAVYMVLQNRITTHEGNAYQKVTF